MSKPVVLIAEELSPATIAVLGEQFEIRHCDGANRAELLSNLASANAVLIRSATKMDAEAVAAAPDLKIIARAGVGLDNVDVPAATAAGVLVVNAPTSNIVSAAELAVSLLLAVARNVVPANLALKNGQWKRSQFGGVELQGKTVGIIGMGKIGMLVAQRLAGFDMNFVAYDPYVASAPKGGPEIKMVSLDELLAASDFVTIHIPKTPETAGLIDSVALAKMKPTAFVINAARGGVLDEDALFDALKSGTIAGAGLDVYATEPCTDSPLFTLDNVVATPHLGASTEEAQEKAGIAVAESVVAAFAGSVVPGAVNAGKINWSLPN
jgi:D-3-phosphoglycerate dehydrogenase